MIKYSYLAPKSNTHIQMTSSSPKCLLDASVFVHVCHDFIRHLYCVSMLVCIYFLIRGHPIVAIWLSFYLLPIGWTRMPRTTLQLSMLSHLIFHSCCITKFEQVLLDPSVCGALGVPYRRGLTIKTSLVLLGGTNPKSRSHRMPRVDLVFILGNTDFILSVTPSFPVS